MSKDTKNNYKFFTNTECEYYGKCHSIKETNCLLCFCPAYNYDCGGDFTLTKSGTKDCSNCLIPHKKNGYDYIINFIKKENEKNK